MENIFIIKDYIINNTDFASAGKAISDAAIPLIQKGDKIIFDMTGQEALSTVFLNTAFGYLMDRFGVEKIKQSLKFRNILRSQGERIRTYFQNYQPINS